MKRVLLLLLCVCATLGGYAQSLKDIRINEVLVKNTSSFEDDFGNHSSWVELHNTSHGRIKLAGCYLVATHSDGSQSTYQIPTDARDAEIGPLGYKIFFCTGKQHQGTWYTNFTLDGVTKLEFLNASKDATPISSVTINPAAQQEDVTIGYIGEHGDEAKFITLNYSTPMATNEEVALKSKSEKFIELDPTGAVLAFTAVSVVFMALLILFILFKLLGVYMIKMANKKEQSVKATGSNSVSTPKNPLQSSHSSEEVIAIAMAMKLYSEDLHDKESEVITINRVARAYSPWSSKIHGLTQTPRK